MDTTSQKTRITDADFGTGLLAGLAAEGVRSISVRGLDAKIVAGFKWLKAQSEEMNLDLRFRMSIDEIHGDSPTARGAIGGAISRGMGTVDNDHTIYLRVAKEDAGLYFARLPANEELWREVARKVLYA